MGNHWELYSSMPGWQDVEARLDLELAMALQAADREVANGATCTSCALKAWNAVSDVMMQPKIENFGAFDTEPRYHLATKIRGHFKRRYGVEVDL